MWTLVLRLWDYTVREFGVVRRAPVTVMFFVLIVSTIAVVLAWAAMEWGYGRIIESQKAQISALQSGVTSPVLGGRTLSVGQRQCLTDALKGETRFGGIIVTVFANDNEARLYGEDFQKVLLRTGHPSGIAGGVIERYQDTGLMIGVVDTKSPSENALRFRSILADCGLHTRVVRWNKPTNLLPPFEGNDFNLFVGPAN